MVSVTVLAVGRLKEPWMTHGVAEYEKRLKGLCQFSVVELPEHRLPLKPSESEILTGLEKEGEQILGKIPPRAKVVVLCIEGVGKSSTQLAELLEEFQGESSQIVFVIGSSYGLAKAVKERGDLRLSLSAMTFPHQLTRLLLCEQIYRGLSILGGSKYHK